MVSVKRASRGGGKRDDPHHSFGGFHMLGPAIMATNRLEQEAPLDHMHVSALVMSTLHPEAPAAAPRATVEALQTEIV